MLSFDTNLLFYAIDEDSPFHADAREFFESLRARSDVAVSELMLAELYRLIRSPRLNRRPLGARAAADVIGTLRNHPSWRLVGFPISSRSVHDKLWAKAAESGFAYRRVFDARLGLTLVDQGVKEFATANVRDFEGLGFERVFDPLAAK